MMVLRSGEDDVGTEGPENGRKPVATGVEVGRGQNVVTPYLLARVCDFTRHLQEFMQRGRRLVGIQT